MVTTVRLRGPTVYMTKYVSSYSTVHVFEMVHRITEINQEAIEFSEDTVDMASRPMGKDHAPIYMSMCVEKYIKHSFVGAERTLLQRSWLVQPSQLWCSSVEQNAPASRFEE